MSDIDLPYFVARPAGGEPGPGVVVIHEGNGISSQLLRVCQRLAHQGYATIAPDLFFRAGGTEARDVVTLMGSLTVEQTAADIAKAIGHLRRLGSGSVGFCMGGLQAYRTALSSTGCDAAVGFYGARIAAELGEPRCPTLLIFGGNDEYIPVADIEAVVHHHPQTVVYPDARHGFMRDGSGSYDDAAATDGWSRMLAFLAIHLGPPDGTGRG
ncbi:MAG TPA: dienelactone hydrolase family protein [Acidimicrobiales bacterium]|nr:dienelactone hydrolase family protein [Acidimicrobiales bacterium]